MYVPYIFLKKESSHQSKKNQLQDDKLNGDEPPEDEIRIILVGATGCGKSSAGNILSKDNKAFKTSGYAKSETLKSLLKTFRICEYKIDIIDTPAVCNTELKHDEVKHEIDKAIALSSPGPHIILLCLPAEAVTKYYTDALKPFEKYFGEMVYDFTLVAFTKCDRSKDKSRDKIKESSQISTLMPNSKQQICLSNKSEGENFDGLEQIIQIINETKKTKKNSNQKEFASCLLSESAEKELKVHIKKERKQSNNRNVSRDAIKTSDIYLKQFSENTGFI